MSAEATTMQDLASEFSKKIWGWYPRTSTAGGVDPLQHSPQPGLWPGAGHFKAPRCWNPNLGPPQLFSRNYNLKARKHNMLLPQHTWMLILFILFTELFILSIINFLQTIFNTVTAFTLDTLFKTKMFLSLAKTRVQYLQILTSVSSSEQKMLTLILWLTCLSWQLLDQDRILTIQLIVQAQLLKCWHSQITLQTCRQMERRDR